MNSAEWLGAAALVLAALAPGAGEGTVRCPALRELAFETYGGLFKVPDFVECLAARVAVGAPPLDRLTLDTFGGAHDLRARMHVAVARGLVNALEVR